MSEFAFKLAKHRGSDTLERVDMKFAIEKLYKIPTPTKATNERGAQALAAVNNAAGSSAAGQASTSNYK